MPGCGRSSGVDHPWKVGEYAEWLVSFFDRIGIRHAATLIGHSNSGAVALQFAANYPERLKSLVLVDSIGAHPTHDLPQMLFGRLIDGISEAVLSLTSFPQLLFNFTFHTRNILNQIRLASAGNLRKTCRHVRVPVLLAWGKRDHTMPPSCAEDMKKLIPRVELYMSPTGSHDWLSTNSEEFSTVLTQFLLRT
jgi:pimeloyl-ACP methyl ester carboxylesterase